ncbi:MAG: hypothetical protein ACI909_003583, partial [Planctomycetota bacterium]
RIFDAGDDFHGATASTAGLDVNVKHPLDALCPRHGFAVFSGY